MEHKITKKMFRGTMIVMIIAELSGGLTTLIDGLITSRYLGPDMISAQGIASIYFPMVSIISGILMVGCQTLVVEAISKGKKENARKILTMCSLVGAILTALITLVIWIAPDFVAVLFGATKGDTETIKNVGDYLKGISIGAVFWMLFTVLTPVLQLDGAGKYCTAASIVMGVVDVGLDILFGVVLKMGLFGMGLASGLSHIASCLVMLLFMLSKKCTMKFFFKKPNFRPLGRVVVNGLPRALFMIGRSVGPILLNVIVLNLAVDGVVSNIGMSALAVQRSVQFCVSAVGWGIGGALLMLGTLYYNERNGSEFKTIALQSIRDIVIFVGGLAIILYFVSKPIAQFFVADYESNLELLDVTHMALRYFFLSLPFVAFNVSFASYTQAIGKNVLTNAVNLCIEFISLVIACYLLSLNHGYKGFFLGFLIGEAALSLVCGISFLINYLTAKNKYKKYMLPADFVKENALIIEKSVHSIEESLSISESISSLCSGTELDQKTIYKLSLCIEEMCVNVFKHGFTKDNKKHHVKIRIVIEGTKVVLTLVDDCKMFDITKKLKSCDIDPENPTKNIGIRMIMLLAKEIHYSNAVNTNNLQVIL